MPIYEVGESEIRAVPKTTYSAAGLRERDDLQRLLRDQIDVVAEDVLVIAEEFGDWSDSRRRIDLLAVDRDANVVVIELKRTDDGGHMELQSVRYAAMVSTMTFEQAEDVFNRYLTDRGREADAQKQLLDFLGWGAVDEGDFAQDVRIVLVSADYSKELTTAVIWLNERDIDIRCVRIRPYQHGETTLIDVQQVIPLPESSDYQVRVRDKKRQERASKKSNTDFTRYDISINGTVYPAQWKRNSILLVAKALHAAGIPPTELKELFAGMGRGNTFYDLPGTISSVDAFVKSATSAEDDRPFLENRWHTRSDDDLFHHAGSTYVMTNQWGIHWPPFMAELKQRYPQIELDYWPTDADS